MSTFAQRSGGHGMKTLILVRHGKSSWGDAALSDKDRPLGERGEHDAPKMGKRLAKRGIKPDLILSSPALRALTTAQLFARELDCKPKDIRVIEGMYASSAADLLEVIRRLSDKIDRVMLVGHNPEFAELAHRLGGITEMPTCAVAEFEFAAKSWADVGKVEPARIAVDTPRQ
jgi:phosphohistidine phosphatase